jgi:hypothetical protein
MRTEQGCRIEFETTKKGAILCRRFKSDGTEIDSITYEEHGVHPVLKVLTKEAQESWVKAARKLKWRAYAKRSGD